MDKEDERLMVSELNGTHQVELVTDLGGQPFGLAVDPLSG